MRLLKLFILIGLLLGYLGLISYPYFFSKINQHDSLGFFSVIEERTLPIQQIFGNQRILEIPDKHLLQGEKLKGTVTASENNFGIVMLKFASFGKVSDQVIFRIKKKGDATWYYEQPYRADKMRPHQYFTFGFPPFVDSKNNHYEFEIESTSGTYTDGIGLSLQQQYPETALVYKFEKNDLKNIFLLSSFIGKKIMYTINNVNLFARWQILIGFIFLNILFLFFMYTTNGKTLVRTCLVLGKKIYKRIKNKMVRNFTLLEKKITVFFRKFFLKFQTSVVYKRFFNTHVKKRFFISFVIFLLAFLYRYATALVDQSLFFYATLGGGGDYDQFMRASTCALQLCSPIIHQNLLIESLILGSFHEFFGFTGGLKAYFYLMIIVSSLVATLPYVLLSRKTWFSIGGIIGSLLLVTSDFLTQVALNFPPDNGSAFLFSLFFIVYLLTMQYGTIRWLIAFGLLGFIDGMFKAFFLINDIVVLALFVPIFFYERIRKAALPFGKQVKVIFKRKNIKIFLLALLPFFIFVILYSAWEYFVQIKFTAPYFLRMLLETGGSNFRFETAFYNRSSGEAEQDLLVQLFYLLIAGLVMIKRMINLSALQIIFLVPIFLGLLYFSFLPLKSKVKLFSVKLGVVIIFFFVTIALLVSIHNNYLDIHQVFPGEYISSKWTLETYVSIFLFASIIFLFILNFKYQAFTRALPILPYVIMLVILTKNAPWERILVHPIIWSIVLISFIVDWMLHNEQRKGVLQRGWIGPVLLLLFILFYTIPKTSSMVGKLQEGHLNYKNELTYLQWVNANVPENAIILAGGESDLVIIGETIERSIIYNTVWSGAVFIKQNELSPEVNPGKWNIISELKNENNFKKNRYLILEKDLSLWQDRITGVPDNLFSTSSATLINAKNYKVEIYKSNTEMNKSIYEFKLQ